MSNKKPQNTTAQDLIDAIKNKTSNQNAFNSSSDCSLASSAKLKLESHMKPLNIKCVIQIYY